MKQHKKWIPVAAGLVIGGVYHLIRGNGVFNKPRFAAQHKAVRRYLDAHYPRAVYGKIKETGNGWSCVARADGRQFMLYITRTPGHVFIFHEQNV